MLIGLLSKIVSSAEEEIETFLVYYFLFPVKQAGRRNVHQDV